MIARQVKQTFLEIKHDSNMGLMNIALSIFRTGSVYKSNSALDSEIQLMPQSDLQGDDNSVNDDFEGGKGFMSFGKYPDLSQADAGLLESPNSPAVDKGFSLNINKITSLNAQAQKVKPSPRGSKFGPIENRTAINPSLTKISPRQGELLSDNKVAKYLF